ncbi:MAG TPA: hypothetical protein PKD83_12480 [Ignavibacteria bacterium]|mgnify:CR=1 FL=1|nr:hypothetical protein [Ignavibacteria bacterium]
MEFFSTEVIIVITIILFALATELGYKLGNFHSAEKKKELEEISSSNSTAVLGMLGFILVFTFGIVYSKYDTRRELVREEANLIRTSWLRSAFLPEPDRAEAAGLFRQYLTLRLDIAKTKDFDKVMSAIAESDNIQHKLWEMAVRNGFKDLNSDVAALYIESLNEMINIQAVRVAVAIQARVPGFIWIFLYLLVFLGMFSLGYQSSIKMANRISWLSPVMIITFTMMITLIVLLDRSDSMFITVSQQPLIDLMSWMGTK